MKRGRPKYKITQADFSAACSYLERNYSEYSFQRQLRQIKKIKSPARLQEFCDDHLTEHQWKKLKTTIISERKRNKDSVPGKKHKNITLTPDAFNQLQAFKNSLHDAGKKYSYSELIGAIFTHLNEDIDPQSAIKLIKLNLMV